MWPIPLRSKAEVVITASAPAIRYLITSMPVCTPRVAASEAWIRPCSTAIHSNGSGSRWRAQLHVEDDLQFVQIEIGLIEAVEEHEAVCAGVDQSNAISPIELKKGST